MTIGTLPLPLVANVRLGSTPQANADGMIAPYGLDLHSVGNIDSSVVLKIWYQLGGGVINFEITLCS